MNLNKLQKVVGLWGEQTFPESTTEDIISYFLEEALELVGIPNELNPHLRAFILSQAEPEMAGDMEEGADCFLLLLRLFEKRGTSLETWAQWKMKQNRIRTLKREPEPGGNIKHQVELSPQCRCGHPRSSHRMGVSICLDSTPNGAECPCQAFYPAEQLEGLHPDCRCGHTAQVHLRTPDGRHQCSAGLCPCAEYLP